MFTFVWSRQLSFFRKIAQPRFAFLLSKSRPIISTLLSPCSSTLNWQERVVLNPFFFQWPSFSKFVFFKEILPRTIGYRALQKWGLQSLKEARSWTNLWSSELKIVSIIENKYFDNQLMIIDYCKVLTGISTQRKTCFKAWSFKITRKAVHLTVWGFATAAHQTKAVLKTGVFKPEESCWNDWVSLS